MSTKRTYDQMAAESEFMPNDEIIRIVEEIVADSAEEESKFNTYKDKYNTFANRYPHLFMAACAPNFDMNRLRYMLRMKDAVDKDRLTQHQASVQIGNHMFTQYVKPFVDKDPSDKSKN